MTSPLRYVALCLAALGAACGETARDPAAPEAGDAQPAAAVGAVTTAPSLRLDAHALYYCYKGGNRGYCMITRHQVRITSSGAALKWKASASRPWIALSATGGTTPSTLTISVVPSLLQGTLTLRGSVTIAAAGASNSPQTILVEVNGLFPPALAFSDSAIGFCYFPASTRACIKLSEDVRVTSTTAPLTWRAVSSAPWIIIHPTSGTTPATLQVSADLSKVQGGFGSSVTGSITVKSGAAYNAPFTIPVKVQFYNFPLPQ